ncbi:MAG: BTAD domain-containing putative transcriptional regulator [Chloroflexota bacterium]
MVQLSLYLFGPPHFERDGAPVSLDRRKAIALSAYLALTDKAHTRDALATLFWPDYDQTRARAALRRTLAALKKESLSDWLEITRKTVGLNPNHHLWVDVTAFQTHLAQILAAIEKPCVENLATLDEALKLYRTDFLAGFTLRDSPAFDEWQLFQTEDLRRNVMSVLDHLVRCHSQQDNLPQAIDYARQWLALDPAAELAHRQLMQLYNRNNQRAAAIRQYQICAKVLQSELGAEPSPETTQLFERIQQGNLLAPSSEESPASTPTTVSDPVPKLNIFPGQSTPFLGRQQDLADILTRLENPSCQLVTLIGPGGIGKTRLAMQTAQETSSLFSDGVYFVPLAFVQSAQFLPSTIADVLNVSLDGHAAPDQQLCRFLRDKQILLVLDNFEHLVRDAHLITVLMTQALGLKILVTSRERLNLQGEWTVEIKGMSYPIQADDEGYDVEAYQSLALFVQSASRVDSGFVFTDTEKPYVARICQLMEGVPLAIELAAAWVRLLSCQEIAAEIEQMMALQRNLDFLTTPLQDVPKRHRSLQAVFDHSWQLLNEEERQLFKQLSVFRGGCRIAAIEAVTGYSIVALSALIDKSLITRPTPGRYQMHELLRQYALEKLRQTPNDAQAVQEAHSVYYASFLQQYDNLLKGAKQEEVLGQISEEIENIRFGWRWTVLQGNVRQIEQALKGLGRFYSMYSRFREGNEIFGQAVEAVRALNTEDHIYLIGQLLTYQGWFLLRQGLYDQAEKILRESLTHFDLRADQANRAIALQFLGVLSSEIGNYDQGRHYLEESLLIFRSLHDRWEEAWTLSHLGNCVSRATEHNQAEARQLLQESLAIYRELEGKQGIAVALHQLGNIALRLGEYEEAKTTFTKSLIVRREIGYPRGIAVTLNKLGKVMGLCGEYIACRHYHDESLQIALSIGAIPLALEALGGFAVPVAQTGSLDQALELLTLVIHHPASSNEVRNYAEQVAAELTSGASLQPNQHWGEQDAQTRFEALIKKIKEGVLTL